MAVLHYRELIAWQRAMELAKSIYTLTRCFPRDELYGLTNQLRRAAVSIPSNIAEGQGRGIGSAFGNFLRIATGSVQEAETQVLLAVEFGYASEKQVIPILDLSGEVRRLLAGLLRSLTNN